MITLFASHEVSDYEKWKALFDRNIEPVIEQNGIKETNAYRTVDGKRVVVSHTFDSLADAEKHQAMMNDPEGQAMVVQHGVVLPATIWIVEELED